MILMILLGILIPIIFALIHTIISTYLTMKHGNVMGLYWNGLGFISKSFFMVFMTYLGVKVLGLNFKIYIPILCRTWFFSHLCEAFYINKLMRSKYVRL